ncbi:G protein-activated inward rectifier potassium channel 3-like [Plodia interpunctella]|uniref:G protein-activated inward rectifier potassium channel 3-like n=1 Tax=Plodia interpunctella TaxID=58824 RepID=UPI0023682122|nr:G protein-activated inward rectifier potassium channel 3-like [Plodia interpunctella]
MDRIYMNIEPERRGSRNRGLERSLSYSAAIGNGSGRSSIEIPSIVNTDVYTNEELKKHYRISQTYVEGREISFPTVTANERHETYPSSGDGLTTDASQYSSEDEHTDTGLTLTIDVENDSPKSESTRHISNASTQPMVSSSAPIELYDRIDVIESLYDELETLRSAVGYSTPYSRRRKKGTKHRRAVQHGRRIRSRRVVLKNGEENVPVRSNIPSKSIKYMRDIVNTVINSKWRFLILGMIVSHFVFWLFFAGIWYAVSTSYADDIGDGKEHCITGTSSFAGLLMMSVETQMTIGYGVRYPNEECPEAIIIMVLEIVAGTALSGGLSSLLFTKLVRPNRHVSSVGFSRRAAICLRDGELCLQFRVWDLLNHHLIASTITAYILKPIRTLEGELVYNYIQSLKLKQANAFLLWPITVVHVINAESPLYEFSAQDMMDYRFEIVVCLTGSSKNMGTVTQSRTSYLSKEIMWGYRFKNVLHYSKKEESYEIDAENLNSVEQVETPLCSASRLKIFEEDIKSSRNILSTPTNVSVSPTNISSQDSIQLGESLPSSQMGDSLPSSPSLNRIAGTQRSFGWSFKRFRPESYFGNQKAS